MELTKSSDGITISFQRSGIGPPLVVVHGSFSDHITDWELVRRPWEELFTLYSVARRGRGETDATEGHSLEDEAKDLIAVLGAVGPPVLLVGHSYGAHVALLAASLVPERVRKLILYEPIWPHVFDRQGLQTLEGIAATGDWSAFTRVFFRDSLHVPLDELDQLRGTETWDQYVNDAKASLGDIRALASYVFDPERFAVINNPVLLQVGTESPRDLYVTDTLAAYLPKVRIEELKGQAHEAATTAPDMYAAAVIRFCQE